VSAQGRIQAAGGLYLDTADPIWVTPNDCARDEIADSPGRLSSPTKASTYRG
jgi:hypothetical protein